MSTFKPYDIVLVHGIAKDAGSYDHQPWSCQIANDLQLTDAWFWLNQNEPSKREIAIDEPIVLVVTITEVTNDGYIATLADKTLQFTDNDILGLAPLPRLLDDTFHQTQPVIPQQSQNTDNTEPVIETESENPYTTVKQFPIIGSDETGCGSYFGGEVVGAVYVRDQDDVDFLLDLGIADSKTISDKKIRELAPKIMEHLPHNTLAATPEQYNQQTDAGNNANKIKAMLHNANLFNLYSTINPESVETVLIDEFVKKKTYFGYLDKQLIPFKQKTVFETKSESKYLAVAAASIIARAEYLKQLDQMNSFAKLDIPQGNGKTVKAFAQEMLDNGFDLRYYAKLHFKITKELTK